MSAHSADAAMQALMNTERTADAAQLAVSFSRPTTSVFGKATEVLKTSVCPEVKDAFARRARELGYPSDSDALREAVILFAFGSDYLQKIHADRIAAVAGRMAGIGTQDGQ